MDNFVWKQCLTRHSRPIFCSNSTNSENFFANAAESYFGMVSKVRLGFRVRSSALHPGPGLIGLFGWVGGGQTWPLDDAHAAAARPGGPVPRVGSDLPRVV